MAVISVNLPDGAQARIRDAFDGVYPGRPAGTTKAAWVEQQIRRYIIEILKAHEADTAASTARTDAVTAVETLMG